MASFGWLWGANGADENQDIEHQSGASRLLNSIFCAICGFPVLLIASMVILGWNEKRSVCDSKAIAAGMEKVMDVACNSARAGDGELVMFQCDLNKTGLAPGSLLTYSSFSTTLSSYVGTGLKIHAEMYQCIEHEHSESKKDNVGGGKTTIKTYTYSREWRSSWVDSTKFHKVGSQAFNDGCGDLHPSWSADVPESKSVYADAVKAGVFNLEGTLIQKISLETPISTGRAPQGWTKNGQIFETNMYVVSSRVNNLGAMRVAFYGTDWNKPKVTVLGKNSGGKIVKWTAPDDWLCSGFQLQDLRMGSMSKDSLFEALREEASSLTIVLRIVGFVLSWIAFCLLAGPLEVAADCIPCVGPCLGDMISAIACCVSCMPATACTLGVIGIVWVAMRPMVGIPLMAIFVIVMGGFAYWKFAYAKGGGRKRLEENDGPQGEVVGGTFTGPVTPHVAKGFLSALRSEYVHGQEGAVGHFFAAQKDAERVLAPYEDRVRETGNPSQIIDELAAEWGLRA
eukprot:TRINITY_DN44769_c0_g1_i1.p1 TRINITY_DN44769_c0_g1~~TRINITY_DN44769_c0_g1_i1.p1  ORF type:complete len:511 (-),score=85.75 TRINITY_DN44769_c0_g1_i1:247-1779(-)